MSIPVNKTLEQIRADMFGRIETVQDEYVAKGWLPLRLNLNKGVIRGMIELWCWGLHQLYLFLAHVLTQAFPSTATGAWLDLWCRSVNVFRRDWTKAQGLVHFVRSGTSGTSGNVRIPAGRILRTPPDAAGQVYRFVTLEDVVLPAGQTEVAVPVEAEEYGAASNVTPGQIVEMVTPVQGVDGVGNRSGWLTSEGADREGDESLRARYSLAWLARNGLTKYAYQAWALEVSGVASVAVLDQHPRGQGTVDVVIMGTAGLPTQDLVDAVTTRIAEDQPQNDDVLVKGPTGVGVAIDAQLELVSGDALAIQAQAVARLQALFLAAAVAGVEPLAVGEDLTRDRMVALLMAIPGVKRIAWTSPAADVDVPADGLAVLESLVVTTSWAEAA